MVNWFVSFFSPLKIQKTHHSKLPINSLFKFLSQWFIQVKFKPLSWWRQNEPFWENELEPKKERYKKVNRWIDKGHLIKLSICNYGIKNVTGFFDHEKQRKKLCFKLDGGLDALFFCAWRRKLRTIRTERQKVK